MSEEQPRRRRSRRTRRRAEAPAPTPPPPPAAPPRRPAVFQPGAWLTFLVGILLGIFFAQNLSSDWLNAVQLVLYLGIALLVALLWRGWARRRLATQRARRARSTRSDTGSEGGERSDGGRDGGGDDEGGERPG